MAVITEAVLIEVVKVIYSLAVGIVGKIILKNKQVKEKLVKCILKTLVTKHS